MDVNLNLDGFSNLISKKGLFKVKSKGNISTKVLLRDIAAVTSIDFKSLDLVGQIYFKEYYTSGAIVVEKLFTPTLLKDDALAQIEAAMAIVNSWIEMAQKAEGPDRVDSEFTNFVNKMPYEKN